MQNQIEAINQKIKSGEIFGHLSKAQKITGILIILTVSFLLYQSLLAKQFLRLGSIELEFYSQKKLFNFYKGLQKGADDLIEDTKEKEMNLTQIKEMFVNEDELPNYFVYLRNLIKSHNLELVSLDFRPLEAIVMPEQESLEFFQRLPLDISVKGNYLNIMFLVYKLENDKPLLGVNSVRIRQEGVDSYDVSMVVKAAIYIFIKKT